MLEPVIQLLVSVGLAEFRQIPEVAEVGRRVTAADPQ